MRVGVCMCVQTETEREGEPETDVEKIAFILSNVLAPWKQLQQFSFGPHADQPIGFPVRGKLPSHVGEIETQQTVAPGAAGPEIFTIKTFSCGFFLAELSKVAIE